MTRFLTAVAICYVPPVATHGAERTLLFDSATLSGSEGEPGVWRVQSSAIVGGSLDGNARTEFLVTLKSYRNFLLRLDYRLEGSDPKANGAFQFRSERLATLPDGMIVRQADLSADYTGKLNDEGRRRRFLAVPANGVPPWLEKLGDWNKLEIVAEEPRDRADSRGGAWGDCVRRRTYRRAVRQRA